MSFDVDLPNDAPVIENLDVNCGRFRVATTAYVHQGIYYAVPRSGDWPDEGKA